MHYDDLILLNNDLSPDNIFDYIKKNPKIKFKFNCLKYSGKYDNSVKAVNLRIINFK